MKISPHISLIVVSTILFIGLTACSDHVVRSRSPEPGTDYPNTNKSEDQEQKDEKQNQRTNTMEKQNELSLSDIECLIEKYSLRLALEQLRTSNKVHLNFYTNRLPRSVTRLDENTLVTSFDRPGIMRISQDVEHLIRRGISAPCP